MEDGTEAGALGRARVMVADGQRVFSRGLRALIDDAAGLEPAGEAADVEHAVAAVARSRPALLVVDAGLPGGGGAEAVRRARAEAPGLAVLALAWEHDAAVDAALAAGASGWLSRGAAPAELLEAIAAAAHGVVTPGR